MGRYLLAFEQAVFYGGLGLAVFGVVVLCGIAVHIKDIEVKPSLISSKSGVAGLACVVGGALLIGWGLVAPSSEVSAEPPEDPQTTPSVPVQSVTTMATVAPAGVSLDAPQDRGTVILRCDDANPDVCWVNASGRLGTDIGPSARVYALVASESDSGGQPDYWIQYDSTIREGQEWSAQVYVDGDDQAELTLKAVVLPEAVEAPADEESGLLFVDAWAGEPLAESNVVQVTPA